MKNDKTSNPVIAKAQVSPRPAADTQRRQWADPADTAALPAADERRVDGCEHAKPIIHRDERTMAEAVAEIRAHDVEMIDSSPWAVVVVLAIALLVGFVLGASL